MDEPTRRLAQEPVGRLLMSFSLPAIAGMVAGSLYGVIDRAFLGNVVGPEAIAGVSICLPIMFVMMAFGMLIGMGSGALVSIRLGEKKHGEAEEILGNALTITIVMALVLTVALRAALDPLLVLFGASPAVLPYARQFMHVLLLGSVLQYVAFGLNAIIRAEGNPRLAMMTMLLNAGLNIVLDAVFIPVLHLGVTGAAVATVISQGVAAFWTLAHFRSRRSVLRLRWKNMRPRFRVLAPMLAIGLAPFTMHIAGSVVAVLINRALARHGGDDAISAYGIIGSVAMLMLMPVFGLNQGAQPIIGYNHGAGRQDRVRRTLLLASLCATAVVTTGFAAAQLFPEALISAFSQEPRIVQLGARGMRVVLLLAPVVGFQVVAASYFQAIGRASFALVLTLLRQVIVLIPLVLILPPVFGLDGVWAAPAASDGVAGVLTAVALFVQLRWRNDRAAPARA